ncbi:MAG TPA: 30S ribosomal protein S6 [Spirochaetales bacterium]|nr:30S ribosomal protein S6 [Spirochaetales bacterium]MBP7262555.1 30S ribosomal protein S6 [Spirochaetia bacterium]HPE36457.1 30S ribosomal protein S6 [Spirochaetales bacterium]
MRSYELMTIFPPEDEFFRQGKEAVLAELKKQGAETLNEEDRGERQLAYPVKGRPRGHYILYTFKMPQEKIIAAEKVFKLNTNILKYLFVRVDG